MANSTAEATVERDERAKLRLVESAPSDREKWMKIGGYTALAVVVACVGLMSWSGLVGYAQDQLRMHAPLQYAVPVALDFAGMACGFLAVRAVIKGDSAFGPRTLVLAFVAASSMLNYLHAQAKYHFASAELFFAGMSVAAWLMWDVVLRQLRRDLLRSAGVVENPLPRFRGLRWALFPKQTFRALSVAVQENLSTPTEALQALKEEAVSRQVDVEIDVTVLPKRDALMFAFSQIGSTNVPKALEWLEERGVTIDRSDAYKTAKAIQAAQQLQLAPTANAGDED